MEEKKIKSSEKKSKIFFIDSNYGTGVNKFMNELGNQRIDFLIITYNLEEECISMINKDPKRWVFTGLLDRLRQVYNLVIKNMNNESVVIIRDSPYLIMAAGRIYKELGEITGLELKILEDAFSLLEETFSKFSRGVIHFYSGKEESMCRVSQEEKDSIARLGDYIFRFDSNYEIPDYKPFLKVHFLDSRPKQIKGVSEFVEEFI